MVQQTLFFCDACHKEGTRTQAHIVSVVVRDTDPDNPAEPVIIGGAVEVCSKHQEPIDGVAGLLTGFGRPLDEEERTLLVGAVRLVGAPASKRGKDMLCMECVPPKQLRIGSIPGHARTQHHKTMAELRFEPDPSKA